MSANEHGAARDLSVKWRSGVLVGVVAGGGASKKESLADLPPGL